MVSEYMQGERDAVYWVLYVLHRGCSYLEYFKF